MGVILLIVGGTVTYYGRKFFPWVIAVIGGGTAFLAAMLLCSVIGMLKSMENNGRGNIGLTVLAFIISGVIGILAGWFLRVFLRIGACFLGAVCGFFLGGSLYNLAFYWANSLWLLICVSFGLAILGAFLAYRFYNQIIIFSTSLIGSYAFIRGISLFAGHYPNEVMIYSQIANGVKPELTWEFYAYFSGMVVMFVSGCAYQYWRWAKHHDDPHYNKHYDDHYDRYGRSH